MPAAEVKMLISKGEWLIHRIVRRTGKLLRASIWQSIDRYELFWSRCMISRPVEDRETTAAGCSGQASETRSA
jgi:hypothetical protein